SLSRVSNVMYELLNDRSFPLSGNFDPATDTFSYGNPDFRYAEPDRKSTSTVELENYPVFDWQLSLKLRPVPERVRSEDQRISISTGLLAHEILSRVRYLDDVKEALNDVKFTMGLSEAEFENLREQLRSAFRNPEVKAWFSSEWQVRNEQGIFAGGEEYRPDRVIHRDGQTLVIDYKTGKSKRADINQMNQYLALIRQMYPGHAEGRILYLENMQITAVS
ncbi:MAG: PD-(D/E)XK nuclease family protein, partial [Cyclobacteriaceae bacterium]